MFNKIKYFLPNLKQAWIICAYIIFLGSALGLIIALPLTILNTDYRDNQIATSLVFILSMTPAIIYIFTKGNINYHKETIPVKLDNPNFGKLNFLFLFLISYIFVMCSSIILEPLTSWIPMSESVKTMFNKIAQPGIFNFITLVLLAPLLEEFIFRGMIARGMFFNNNATKGIVWSAFLFALIHFNIWQGLGAFCLGAYMAWIYFRTHSLKMVIAIHAANNCTAYLMTCLFPNIEIETSFKDLLDMADPNLYPFVYILSIGIVIITLFYLKNILPNKDTFKINKQVSTSTLENYE